MARQLYYDDVEVGLDLPTLVKHPTSMQLVMWAGASGDYHEHHYDKDIAISRGLPGIIVHGPLLQSFLVQTVTDWIGEQGTVKKLSCTYRALAFPGEDFICKGKVTKKYVQDGEKCVECEVSGADTKGEIKAICTVVAALFN